MNGEMLKTVLEDVCDNLFNPDPYYQQGGDMVRVGGLQYTCNPLAAMGQRITDMRLGGKPIEAGKQYKVAGWAPGRRRRRQGAGRAPGVGRGRGLAARAQGRGPAAPGQRAEDRRRAAQSRATSTRPDPIRGACRARRAPLPSAA